MRKQHLVIGITALTLLLAFPSPGQAQVTCTQVVPTGAISSNILLGTFYELGLRCRPGYPFYLVLGGRYSEQHPTVNPFAVLSYTQSFAPGWSGMLVASHRERLGDYEGHRLPELLLRYFGPGPGWVPHLELSAGSITMVTPAVQSTRLGALAGLQTPAARVTSGVGVVARLQGGTYSYGSGASQTYYRGDIAVTTRLARATTFDLVYAQQGGSGTSPLLYDLVGFEQVLTGRLTWPAAPELTGIISASANLHTPTITGREYVLQFNNHTWGWTAGLIYRVSDGRLFLHLTF